MTQFSSCDNVAYVNGWINATEDVIQISLERGHDVIWWFFKRVYGWNRTRSIILFLYFVNQFLFFSTWLLFSHVTERLDEEVFFRENESKRAKERMMKTMCVFFCTRNLFNAHHRLFEMITESVSVFFVIHSQTHL